MISSSRLHKITSLNNPKLQPYRTLRRPQEHLDQGIFVAEGEKVVLRMLAAKLPVISLLLSDEWLERLTSSGILPEEAPYDVFVGEKKLLETIVGFRMHQGIMGVAHVPAEPALESLVGTSPSPRLFVALDGLVFAENVGVVVRNCAAFGVQGILSGTTSASPYLRRAVRNSMGTMFRLPVMHASLPETLTVLRSNYNMSVIIADAHAKESLYNIDCRADMCFVFGNEDSGVSPLIQSIATHNVKIPMKEGVDSLNVASASAVVLAEISRQRSFL